MRYAIYAKRGRLELHFSTERKFADHGTVKTFPTAELAVTKARALIKAHRILRGFKISVRPHGLNIAGLKQNPDPEADSRRERAAQLLEDFSGHEATRVMNIEDKPIKTGLAIGDLDFVGYTAVRDGKRERYIHHFPRNSRPLLAASHDGRQLRILGGEFEFTDAGIEG